MHRLIPLYRTRAAVFLLLCGLPLVEPDTATRFKHLSRESAWKAVSADLVSFDTFHPQGFAKVGDTLFVSSVEVIDRAGGRGRGHLFRMHLDGTLIDSIELGEGPLYHPGGIDFDGTFIWVPVAAYRPDSETIVYRVDPVSMEAVEVFRFADHIGGLVHNTDDHTLHGVSWGSRRFYTWPLDADLRPTNAHIPPEQLQQPNPSHYIDYQDCRYLGDGQALCSGLSTFRPTPDALPFALGGLDLIDLRTNRPVHQVPLLLWTETGRSLAQNPVELELSASGFRAYFMPEDNRSRLFIYEVDLPRPLLGEEG